MTNLEVHKTVVSYPKRMYSQTLLIFSELPHYLYHENNPGIKVSRTANSNSLRILSLSSLLLPYSLLSLLSTLLLFFYICTAYLCEYR